MRLIGAGQKRYFEIHTSVQIPHPTQAKSNSPPPGWPFRSNSRLHGQSKHSNARGLPGGGGGDVDVSNCSAHKYEKSIREDDCKFKIRSVQNADCRMQIADCRLGIKCSLRPKLGINCRLRAKLSFRAVGDIFSSLTHPCRVIAFPSSFPRNFLSICIDCEQCMSTDRLFFCVET